MPTSVKSEATIALCVLAAIGSGIVGLILAGIMGTALMSGTNALPVSPSKMSQVKEGMHKEQVRLILGAPSKELTGIDPYDNTKWTDWIYSRPWIWKFVRVEFDEKDECARVSVDDD